MTSFSRSVWRLSIDDYPAINLAPEKNVCPVNVAETSRMAATAVAISLLIKIARYDLLEFSDACDSTLSAELIPLREQLLSAGRRRDAMHRTEFLCCKTSSSKYVPHVKGKRKARERERVAFIASPAGVQRRSARSQAGRTNEAVSEAEPGFLTATASKSAINPVVLQYG